MDITLDKKSNTSGLIKISLTEADYQPKVEEKIKDYAKKATMKGFRPGKVPHGLIRKMYGKSILVEEVNHLLGHQLEDYIRDSDLQILGRPIPNEESFSSIDWDNQKDFEFTYELGFAADFEVTLDKKVKVTHYKIDVNEDTVNETIATLQEQHGEMTNPEAAEEDDLVYGEVSATDAELEFEPTHITVDIKEIPTKTQKKQFVGAKAGDALTFDIRKVLGKEDEKVAKVFGNSVEEAASIKGEFTMQVKNINRQNPAELNQEFFDKVIGADKATDEESFRAELKTLLAQSYENETKQLLDQNTKEQLVESFKFEIPEEFLQKWLVESNEELTEEQVKTDFDRYATDIRWQLIESKISKANELKAEHEEILAKTIGMFQGQFGAMAANPEFEEQLKAIANNYLQGENGENYFRMHNMVLSDKVIAFAQEQIKVEEKTVTLDEFKKLF